MARRRPAGSPASGRRRLPGASPQAGQKARAPTHPTPGGAPAGRRDAIRLPLAGLLTLLVAAAPFAAPTPAEAQPNRPIYPVYEGWVPNDDGTAVLVFGYYNHNSVAVEIPAGEANRFEPAPADRGQPTVFEPGRQRNVCFVVLPADHEGNLAWTLTWGESTQTTTERGGLDQLYLIENISRAYHRARRIDTASAPRGVCVDPEPESAGSEP